VSSEDGISITYNKVFKNPECPPTGEVCSSNSTFCLSWEFLHKYKRSLYHSESFFHVNVSDAPESCCNLSMRVHTFSSFFHSSLASIIQRVHLPQHFASPFYRRFQSHNPVSWLPIFVVLLKIVFVPRSI
jgi:hypothetical protein